MLDKILQELEINGFCYVEKVISVEKLMEMNQFFESHKSQFEAAKVGSGPHRERVERIRGDYTYWLDTLNPTEPFASFLNTLNELKDQINTHFFLGLKEFECHLAFYPEGTFYQKHIDRFELDSSRRISFIFYLNQEWKVEWGGELVIYDKQGSELKRFYPLPGSFVCFLSEEFPHEVKASKKERRSLTGWMHNKIIN